MRIPPSWEVPAWLLLVQSDPSPALQAAVGEGVCRRLEEPRQGQRFCPQSCRQPRAGGCAGAGLSGQGRPGQSLALALPHALISLEPPWRSVTWGALVLLGSSISSQPHKVGPFSSGATGSVGCASVPLFNPSLSCLRAKAMDKVFQCGALQNSAKN